MMSNTKKLFIKTYGCQMNVYDSERMVDAMGADGYTTVDTPDEADMILLNTCTFGKKLPRRFIRNWGGIAG